ncbi:MAG TPA: VOC family protein [Albitalea sp.]|nr:VOC family protein [Albitalea sp.]
MSAALDHLVVAARTLDEGVAWCERTFGVTPGPGGRHALMSTHNRVFSIASARFPRAYFELIAIDPAAPAPQRRRWFDLDTAPLQEACEHEPQLVHWVLRCDDIVARCARLRAAGIERGEVLSAQRDGDAGLLRWRISVRADGARLFDGALPTLIEWEQRHPADTLADSGVTLDSFELAGLPAAARSDLVPPEVHFAPAGPPLCARLSTPRGPIVLRAPSLGESHVQP